MTQLEPGGEGAGSDKRVDKSPGKEAAFPVHACEHLSPCTLLFAALRRDHGPKFTALAYPCGSCVEIGSRKKGSSVRPEEEAVGQSGQVAEAAETGAGWTKVAGRRSGKRSRTAHLRKRKRQLGKAGMRRPEQPPTEACEASALGGLGGQSVRTGNQRHSGRSGFRLHEGCYKAAWPQEMVLPC